MKFVNKLTRIKLETNNNIVIEQLKKSIDYEEVKEFTKKEEPIEEKTDKKKHK